MADIITRIAVEGVGRDIQAQLDQNCADALWHEEEIQRQVQEISNQMQTLTKQLNKFKPASEHTVGVIQEKWSDQVQQRFDAQGDRIDKLSEIVLEGQKATQTNVDTLNSLLVGIENLGEIFKKMQEHMVAWQAGYREAEKEY